VGTLQGGDTARLTPQKKQRVGQSSASVGEEERLGQGMAVVGHSKTVSACHSRSPRPAVSPATVAAGSRCCCSLLGLTLHFGFHVEKPPKAFWITALCCE